MKDVNISAVLYGVVLFILVSMSLRSTPKPVEVTVNLTGYEKKLQDFEWKISGNVDQIKELRDITDEFRAQIKGLREMIQANYDVIHEGEANEYNWADGEIEFKSSDVIQDGMIEKDHKNNNKMIIITRDVKTGGNQ